MIKWHVYLTLTDEERRYIKSQAVLEGMSIDNYLIQIIRHSIGGDYCTKSLRLSDLITKINSPGDLKTALDSQKE